MYKHRLVVALGRAELKKTQRCISMCPVTLASKILFVIGTSGYSHHLIDSCHGNKQEHRHFVSRVFFPSSVFSNVLPSRRNNAVNGYIFHVFGYRNASGGTDGEDQEADVLTL